MRVFVQHLVFTGHIHAVEGATPSQVEGSALVATAVAKSPTPLKYHAVKEKNSHVKPTPKALKGVWGENKSFPPTVFFKYEPFCLSCQHNCGGTKPPYSF